MAPPPRVTLYYCISSAGGPCAHRLLVLQPQLLHQAARSFWSVWWPPTSLGVMSMCVYYCLLPQRDPMLSPQAPAASSVGPRALWPTSRQLSPSPQGPCRTGRPLSGMGPLWGAACGDPHATCLPGAAWLTLPTPVPRTLRTRGPVIRIDLPRKKYPAWDAHFIDRRLRKTILALEYSSPTTPRLQYRSVGPQELLEYESTV